MITIIRVLNLNRQTTAILENAYNIGYEKLVNQIWQASFSLPLNDSKVDKVELLKYVKFEFDDITDIFRVIPKMTRKNSDSDYVTFQCEHVIATLLDSSLFQFHHPGINLTTRQNIEYILAQQNHKHWVLGDCEFTRYFEYSWENENLLSALFSIPRAFDEPYIWEWDTSVYPWVLHLRKPSTQVISRIKEGYNLKTLEIEENPMASYNRIYPLGAGEGVNQLTIEHVNGGIPYLEDIAPGEEIKEIIWVDRRYTVEESLKNDAKALLNKWKVPQVTWNTSAADVSSITGLSIDKFKCGTVVRLDVDNLPKVDLRIMSESKSDIKGNPGDVNLNLGNVVEDLGTTQSDLERRQQINEIYSQGATNIFAIPYQDNCDNNIPAVIPFYIDDNVVKVNAIELTFRTKRFRAYSQATKGGGGIVKSTGGGGGTVKSTSSGGGTTRSTTSGGGTTRSTTNGGGVAKSTESGGGSTQTSSAGGDHRHLMYIGRAIPAEPPPERWFEAANGAFVSMPSNATVLTTYGSSDVHTHGVNIPNHSHSFNIPNHSHDVTIPAHSHEVVIPDHTHEIDLPDHTHEIELPDHTHEVDHKIVELSTIPSTVTIKVDGNTVPHTSINGDRIKLIDYINKDSNGKVTRGRHEVEILPNGLARIEADLIFRVYIQSQYGGDY